MTAYAALAGRMQASLHDLEQVVNRAEALLGKAQQQNDADYLDGVALNLHGFYAGVERIFEDIARTLDESVPSYQQLSTELASFTAFLRDLDNTAP
ncbi:hypothetical protein [Candidatus Chloroploca sp. Khr17]|uniref:hypothetical protein n=1 Tax=Candidatus Chloroploca sp. Khr17 TaxID=2496869 RepID=UPI00101D3B93|nr:hypothetical protein [Candidatus Chloroploca sp. Khr17]